MARLRYFPLFAALAIAAALCPAQETQSAAAYPIPKEKPVPAWVEPAPFPVSGSPLAPGFTVEVRTPDQLTEQDRLREADAESSIAERAGFADLEFNAGKWSYRQLVCPDFPNHLFLRFTRDNGAGDQSMFSASIPLNGNGHVRIIPILRRSYTLFSPAPINAITVSAFNHIRSEEDAPNPQSWVGTALCYAALAGANPVAVPRGDASLLPGGFPAASAPELKAPVKGDEVIYLGDESAKPKPVVWTMTFSRKGRLMNVKRPSEEVNRPKPVPTGPQYAEKPAPPVIDAQ